MARKREVSYYLDVDTVTIILTIILDFIFDTPRMIQGDSQLLLQLCQAITHANVDAMKNCFNHAEFRLGEFF